MFIEVHFLLTFYIDRVIGHENETVVFILSTKIDTNEH